MGEISAVQLFFGDVRDSREVEARIPDIHTLPGQSIPAGVNGAQVYKTHFLWNSGHPNYDSTERAIYVIRHPKDVLLSNLNYFRLLSGSNIDAEKFARSFIECMGAPYWLDRGVGSLVENAGSWTLAFDCPHTVVRYEDLHGHPEEAFGDMLKFLEVEPDKDRVVRAVRASEFSRMKLLEAKERESRKPGFVFQIHPNVQHQDSSW